MDQYNKHCPSAAGALLVWSMPGNASSGEWLLGSKSALGGLSFTFRNAVVVYKSNVYPAGGTKGNTGHRVTTIKFLALTKYQGSPLITLSNILCVKLTFWLEGGRKERS